MRLISNVRPSRFVTDEQGATGMIFAITLMVMVLFMGISVDLTRAFHTNQAVSNAADAAAIAAAKGLREKSASLSDLQTIASKLFEANIKSSGGRYAKISDFKADIDQDKSLVKISFKAEVPTVFARAAGYDKITMTKSSTAVFGTRDIEVGLALDITGSMGASIGGKKKIDALKEAVTEFATTLMPATPVSGQSIRVAMAPYSAAVNLGSFAATASNNRSSDGCVTERTTSDRYSDKSPSSGGSFRVAGDGRYDIDGTEGLAGSAYLCPVSKVKPLTDKRQDIIDEVNTYREGGWTGGHFGAQWAWNLISEDWASVWGSTSKPDTYSKIAEKKLYKAIVLMTDGVFNTAYHNDTSSKQALELCRNMKDRGVVVFAVAFNAPSGAKKTLQDCATPGDAYYADASDADDLKTAFKQFAATIGALRLSQ
jgi:Flp pilus assembly protein TadG